MNVVASVNVVFADERKDQVLDSYFVNALEGLEDLDSWANELHEEFRKVILGEDFINDSKYDYFGH